MASSNQAECKCKTLPQLVRDSTISFSDNDAIDGTTYAQLQELTDRYVSGLRATSHIDEGDAVCLFFSQKSVHAVALALAIMRLGAVYIPLDPSFPQNRLVKQCNATGLNIRGLVYGPEQIDCERTKAIEKELGVPACSASSVEATERSTVDVSACGDLAVVLFTSGTTGLPKSVPYKHRHFSLSLEACAQAYDFNPTTRVCNVVPYIWDGGNFDLFGPLLRGGAVSFCHQPTPDNIARTIVDERCTWILLPPSLIAEMDISALATLEILVSGGEAASPSKFKQWATQLPSTRLINAFGLTETGIMNSFWECQHDLEELGRMDSVPIGVGFVDNTLFVDEDTSELVIAGPQVPDGYLETAKAGSFFAPPNRYSKQHTAMRTGDFAWRDDNGLFHVGGRSDDRLSIFSLRIEPADTEWPACAVEKVDFAHLFVHDMGEGQTPALALAYHVAGNPGCNSSASREVYDRFATTYERQIREHLNQEVPEFQRPSTYVPLSTVPRLFNGKKDGKRIGELAQEAQEKGLVDFHSFHLSM